MVIYRQNLLVFSHDKTNFAFIWQSIYFLAVMQYAGYTKKGQKPPLTSALSEHNYLI